MNVNLISILAFFFIMTFSNFSSANSLLGVWQTEAGEAGGYLHVEFNSCGEYLCGLIIGAYDKNNSQDKKYEHIGKKIVWDMQKEEADTWNDGEIWDPEKDKTYSSKMKLVEGDLKVSGCIAFICRSQIWRKVEVSKS